MEGWEELSRSVCMGDELVNVTIDSGVSAADILLRMQAQQCAPKEYDTKGMRELFACKRIAFLGDSVIRGLMQNLLTTLNPKQRVVGDTHRELNFKTPGGIHVDFFWQRQVPAYCSLVCLS
jgi:hypothetical protein